MSGLLDTWDGIPRKIGTVKKIRDLDPPDSELIQKDS